MLLLDIDVNAWLGTLLLSMLYVDDDDGKA